MSHPDIAWYCGECGYPRHHETPHTCPWCSHNTATPSFGVPSIEDLRRALDEMDAIVPPAPRVDFYAVPGSTDVAVLADDVPIKVLTAAQFEEVKRRLESP